VPTDRGYRYYVELLMHEERELAPAERRTLRQQFNHSVAAGSDSTHLASSLLARTLHSAAVATPPSAATVRLRRLELVPLEDDLVLVTLLLQSGTVRQVVHKLDQSIERDELTRLSNELSDKLADKSAGQIRRAQRSDRASQELRLGGHASAPASPGADVRRRPGGLDPTPESASSPRAKLRPIIEVLEHQPLLARFLAESLATPACRSSLAPRIGSSRCARPRWC
jgi:transcriptional regulator of heat shock response